MSSTPQTTQPGQAAAATLSARVLGWLTGSTAEVVDVSTPVVEAVTQPRQATVDELRTKWSTASADGGWLAVSDWWDPACDAVTEALVAGGDPGPAIFRLGHVRAELGCGIEETIDDVVALWRVFGGTEPPVGIVRQLAAGWADAGLTPVGADSCIDPITRLFTKAYLEARLGELYRQGRSGLPADEYTLVVVDVGDIPRMDSLVAMGRVAEALRRVCCTGETVAVLAPGRAVALCRQGADLAGQLSELDVLLGGGQLGDSMHAAIWTESLPRRFSLVQSLLQDLSR